MNKSQDYERKHEFLGCGCNKKFKGMGTHNRVGPVFKKLEFSAQRKTLFVGVPQKVTYQI